MAKLKEEVEAWQDMGEHVNALAKLHVEFTPEERSLFSVAWKNIVGSRRAAHRVVSALINKEKSKDNTAKVKLVEPYLQKVSKEINEICMGVQETIEKDILPFATTAESKATFHKMIGDYARYLCEIEPRDSQTFKTLSEKALKAYQTATEEAAKSLSLANPIRLGVALNFSVFYYEIMGLPEKACEIAKKAFDDAISDNNLSDEEYKDATVIMQLLRDNLNLWTAEGEDKGVGDDDKDDEAQ